MDPKVRRTVDKQSYEEGELSPENGEFLNGGHDTEAEFSKSAKKHAYSDDSNHKRLRLLLSASNYDFSYNVNFATIKYQLHLGT